MVLLATIILRYQLAFPEDIVGYVLVVALFTPPLLAVWFEVSSLMEDMGYGGGRLGRGGGRV